MVSKMIKENNNTNNVNNNSYNKNELFGIYTEDGFNFASNTNSCKELSMDNKTIHKEILRAMIISSYKDNLITLKEYTDMIRKLDKR